MTKLRELLDQTAEIITSEFWLPLTLLRIVSFTRHILDISRNYEQASILLSQNNAYLLGEPEEIYSYTRLHIQTVFFWSEYILEDWYMVPSSWYVLSRYRY